MWPRIKYRFDTDFDCSQIWLNSSYAVLRVRAMVSKTVNIQWIANTSYKRKNCTEIQISCPDFTVM